MLLTGELYSELGLDYVRSLDKDRMVRRYVARLEALGFEVTLAPKPTAA